MSDAKSVQAALLADQKDKDVKSYSDLYVLVPKSSLLKGGSDRKESTISLSDSMTFGSSPVKENSDGKTKSITMETTKVISRAIRHMRGAIPRAMNGSPGYKIADVVLVENAQLGSSANTAYNTVKSLLPTNAQDWSSFAAVFDLVKVLKVRIHVSLNCGGTALSGSAAWGAAFDPANSGTYSNVQDVMTADKKLAPLVVFASVATSPDFVSNPTGYYVMDCKLVPNKVTSDTSGSLTDLVGGGWFSTGSTGQIVGYYKPYVPALGSGTTSNQQLFIEYHCRFAYRT